MKVIINDYVVSYDKSGKGPVIVLLHGWGDNKDTFLGLIKDLKNQYTVVTVDLLGFGGSDFPREAYDLGAYAQFVADFLHKIDLQHVYAFIGHSNGGAIAIKGLASGTLNSEKLVLLASSGVRSSYTNRKKVLRMAAKTAKYPVKLLPSRMQYKLKKSVYSAIGSDLFVAENLQDTFKKVVTEDLVVDSAMIRQKTLLIYGTNDRATPVEYGRKLKAQIEDSKLKIVEGADHFLHQSHTTKLLPLILEFLNK